MDSWKEDLFRIFEENKDKRICVLGTSCTGKTTLIEELNIDDELLLERTTLRKTDFENAKNMQRKIENEIANSNIETIVKEVNQSKKYYKM